MTNQPTQGPTRCGAQQPDVPTRADSPVPNLVVVNGWDLDHYLDAMLRARLDMPSDEIAALREFFFDATPTEYDAEHLWQHLQESKMLLTPEFLAFAQAWRRDEHRHFLGFCRLYARLYPDLGERALAAQIAATVPNFEPLRDLLGDEFSVLAAVAFDEACTAKSYADQRDMYGQLGEPVFAEWIRHVAHDEVNHMRNAIEVMRLRHRHRLPEFDGVLDRFVAHDRRGAGYGNTFLFAHYAYSPEFVQGVAKRLKRHVRRALA